MAPKNGSSPEGTPKERGQNDIMNKSGKSVLHGLQTMMNLEYVLK